MKKLLLFGALILLFVGNVFAGGKDVTPKNYHFYEADRLPISNTHVAASNFSEGAFESINGAEQFDNGLIAFTYNSISMSPGIINSGLQLVNLGGEVGQVLCFAGYESSVNEALKSATGYDYNIKTANNYGGWFNMNFFTPPTDTPTTGIIRVKITCNIWHNNYDADKSIISSICAYNNAVESLPVGDDISDSGINADVCYSATQSGAMVYDPSKWLTYEWDVPTPDVANTPMFIKVSLSSKVKDSAIFIRDISLTHHADLNSVRHDVGERIISYRTLRPGNPQSGVEYIDNNQTPYTIDGNAITFSTPAAIYSITGQLIARATAGKAIRLARGIYIATIASKAIKFIIK